MSVEVGVGIGVGVGVGPGSGVATGTGVGAGDAVGRARVTVKDFAPIIRGYDYGDHSYFVAIIGAIATIARVMLTLLLVLGARSSCGDANPKPSL